jgi:beta-glucosidase
LDVSVNVTNTSNRAGDEVVELYTHQRSGSASRPSRELKGFDRIALKSGEMKSVTLHLSPADLSFWSPATHQRSAEASTYDVWVGDISSATEHAQFDVNATSAQP